jgi:hypothetical protein
LHGDVPRQPYQCYAGSPAKAVIYKKKGFPVADVRRFIEPEMLEE